MIIFLLTLILVSLLILTVGMLLIWQKVNLYLVWNTRNESLEYEAAITKPKFKKAPVPASKTEQRGRNIKPVEDLVNLEDLDFETAVKAIEQEA